MKGLATLFFIICCFSAVYGRTILGEVSPKDFSNDEVVLFTDRSVYIAGEAILFSARVLNKSGDLSKVLFVELITPDGQKITGGKFIIEKHSSSGLLQIPNDVFTGNYYIKGYTKWMRNFSLSEYFFVPIKIVNPASPDLLQSTQTPTQIDSSVFINYPELIDSNLVAFSNYILPRRVQTSLSLNLTGKNKEINYTTLSIVPSRSISAIMNIKPLIVSENGSDIQYIPDSKGLTLTGRIIDKENGTPTQYTQVNLSILGLNPDFIATRSDSTGRFAFSLPSHAGKNEIYIGIEEKSNSVIKIDNDFCTRQVSLPFIPFALSEDEHTMVINMIRNLEVEQLFYTTEVKEDVTENNLLKIPFYGIPDNTFEFDNYVNLLSVEEYFHELIPSAFVRKRDGKNIFSVNGTQPEIKVYDPLVLIDYIAVDRVDRLLAANPKLLSKIDIVTKPYYKGDMVFGGIISFFSNKGDLAGIDLPPSDMFIEFEFFTKTTPSHQNETPLSENLPDTRNTLVWKDNLKNIDISLPITFYTPDTPGEYTINLRGFDKNGRIVTLSKNFIVI